MKKTICLDYDGTYTAFPELFETFILIAKKQNHKVILATMRFEDEKDDCLVELEKKLHKVYYTGGMAKLPFLKNMGIEPDIWIDDKPNYLFEDMK